MYDRFITDAIINVDTVIDIINVIVFGLVLDAIFGGVPCSSARPAAGRSEDGNSDDEEQEQQEWSAHEMKQLEQQHCDYRIAVDRTGLDRTFWTRPYLTLYSPFKGFYHYVAP